MKQITTTMIYQPAAVPENLSKTINETDSLTTKIQINEFDSDRVTTQDNHFDNTKDVGQTQSNDV